MKALIKTWNVFLAQKAKSDVTEKGEDRCLMWTEVKFHIIQYVAA